MTLRNVSRALASGFVVYVAFAACSASEAQRRKGSTGTGGAGGSLENPVRPATADESGTRLKIASMKSDDGLKLTTGVFDATRNEECVIAVAADGAKRCLPLGSAVVANAFADSQCSQPIVEAPPCSSAAKYVDVTDSKSCNPRHQLFEVAERTQVHVVYYGPAEDCTPGYGDPNIDVITLGAAVPPTSFVAVHESTD